MTGLHIAMWFEAFKFAQLQIFWAYWGSSNENKRNSAFSEVFFVSEVRGRGTGTQFHEYSSYFSTSFYSVEKWTVFFQLFQVPRIPSLATKLESLGIENFGLFLVNDDGTCKLYI